MRSTWLYRAKTTM
jgi:hypothetical protein